MQKEPVYIYPPLAVSHFQSLYTTCVIVNDLYKHGRQMYLFSGYKYVWFKYAYVANSGARLHGTRPCVCNFDQPSISAQLCKERVKKNTKE